MKNYEVFIPTYNRKEPNCLALAELGLDITLCVRREAIQEHFYDHLDLKPHIKMLDCGPNLYDSGGTRIAIMEYCHKMGIKYAVMLDDPIDDVYSRLYPEELGPQDVIEKAVDRLENDPLKEYCILFQFNRPERKYTNMPEDTKYFLGMPLQAFVVNVELAYKYGLQFGTRNDVGFEDEAFFIDSVKAGLITCSDADLMVSGGLPNVPKAGGSHANMGQETLEQKYDRLQQIFLKHIGPTYGVYLTKAYRSSIGGLCCYGLFDYAYFYEVLVRNREKNKEIIDSHFEIKQ